MLALPMLAIIEGYYAFVTATLFISGGPWKRMLLITGCAGLAWLVAVFVVHLILKWR